MATVLAHVQTSPVPPSRRTEIEIPESLERVVLTCLEKDPVRRPATAGELIELLDACTDAEPWSPERAERWWSAHLPGKVAAAAATDGSS
jgi:serine/threonine-protein kinase